MGSYYMSAAQVRIDVAQSTRFRIIIAINNQMDIHNGLHVTDGNQGSTNFRSLRIVGSVYLKKGERTSVAIYSTDPSWRVQTESGFSCHKFVTKLPCGGIPIPPATEPPIMDGMEIPPT